MRSRKQGRAGRGVWNTRGLVAPMAGDPYRGPESHGYGVSGTGPHMHKHTATASVCGHGYGVSWPRGPRRVCRPDAGNAGITPKRWAS